MRGITDFGIYAKPNAITAAVLILVFLQHLTIQNTIIPKNILGVCIGGSYILRLRCYHIYILTLYTIIVKLNYHIYQIYFIIMRFLILNNKYSKIATLFCLCL